MCNSNLLGWLLVVAYKIYLRIVLCVLLFFLLISSFIKPISLHKSTFRVHSFLFSLIYVINSCVKAELSTVKSDTIIYIFRRIVLVFSLKRSSESMRVESALIFVFSVRSQSYLTKNLKIISHWRIKVDLDHSSLPNISMLTIYLLDNRIHTFIFFNLITSIPIVFPLGSLRHFCCFLWEPELNMG